MKKKTKFLVQVLIFMTILLSGSQVLATDFSTDEQMRFSEEFENYLNMDEEERKNLILPRIIEIPKTTRMVTNPLRLAKMLGSTLASKYSLTQDIPKNMVVKNQQQTNSCWTFSSLAALESNLALKDNDNKVYDFSERHMEYATSQSFLNGITNTNGFNRLVGSGGNSYLFLPYLTNGIGAIPESEMPFENNEDSIYISEIQNKTVATQVNDTITFPAYSSTDDKTLIKQQMKEHIKNYGAIDAGIYGASINDTSCYNNETGAIYCNNTITYRINHAVAIVGWDDNYSVENFVEGSRPKNNGAWIIKNSWGTGEQYTLEEMKEYIYNSFPEEREKYGWISPESISDEFALHNFKLWGYTIDENNIATFKIGDNGFMYVSYEDVNIYKQLTGIIDAQTEIKYENIYQYGEYSGPESLAYPFGHEKVYLATVNDRKSSVTEYLTHVAIHASETYTCKVYVNPNGTSMSMNDLQLVQLKSGEIETFDVGYHTLEFLNPVKITGSKFVVVLEIQSADSSVSGVMEFNPADYAAKQPALANLAEALAIYNNVIVEPGKTFWTYEAALNANQWCDTSTMCTITQGSWPDFNTTLKAFTTSKILENITIATPPTKTSYIVGEDFDKTGMVVKANYANEQSIEISDYTVTNGENLGLGQTSVTISYQGKTVSQAIEVTENTVESIAITTPPTKTEYWAGEDFDSTGMVLTATYKGGTTKTITDYTIKDGKNLKNNQTTITIEYQGKTTIQTITVNENSVIQIEITQEPTKTQYVVGQNFNTEGMIVKATYANEIQKEITDYTIMDGTNLQLNQTAVTIEYEEKTITQAITVIEKAITGIKVKTMPTKIEYIQNKEELDLTGGVIEVSYNDDTKEEVQMTSSEITVTGFSNEELGTKTIILTYLGQTTQFDVVIKELPQPENSNFDEATADVQKVKIYTYTDADKTGHVIVEVQINNVQESTVNDSVEYYYNLSKNPNEENISNWVKINSMTNANNNMQFEIDTRDVENYDELANEDKLYLYIKEVAIRNDIKKEKITASLELSAENEKFELYVDDVKKEDVNLGGDSNQTPGEDPDNTLAPGKIPQAGKNALMLIMIVAVLIIGRISYFKYKDIQIK